MKRRYDTPLRPKSDLVFRILFGAEGSEEVLAGILSAALDERLDFRELRIIDPVLKGDVDAKAPILDVLAKTTDGQRLHCEVQLQTQPAFKERVAYMNARLMGDQMVRGDDYTKLMRAVSVVIADFHLAKDSDSYVNRYCLNDPDTGSRFSGIMQIVTIELCRIPDDSDDALARWMRFVRAESYQELDELAKSDPVIEKAVDMIEILSEDEKLRRLEEQREQARRDEVGRREYAIQQGFARGKAEGEAKLIGSMSSKGLSVAQIADLTGCPEEQVSGYLAGT